MEKEILNTLRYFAFFSYPVTADEIYLFLKKKAQKGQFLSILKKMEKEGEIMSFLREQESRYFIDPRLRGDDRGGRQYTLPQYSKKSQMANLKWQISQKKINKIKPYIKLLAIFPQIKLVGLSGTVAMLNAKKEDDVDLFIICAKNRLWTGRFISLILAQIFGLRRMRGVIDAPDKVCLNLFFDEGHLEVPNFKKTEYVAHEILQMKPLVAKDKVYERFLEANRWALQIFPNNQIPISKQIPNSKFQILNSIGAWIEAILKKFQLYFIRKHQTKEIITDSQLWFHPEDFGKKLQF